jgi:hypothetical protein
MFLFDTSLRKLVTCIPLVMLWKVRITWHRKAALIVIFSATLLTIAMALVRVVESVMNEWDTGWFGLWCTMECCTGI